MPSAKKSYAEMVQDCVNQMGALLDKAKAENRDLSEDEVEVFNSLEADQKKYKDAAEREERLSKMKNDLRQPANNSQTPRVDVKNDNSGKFSNFGEYLLAVKNYYSPNPTVDDRLASIMAQNATGMSVAVSADGGFMVGSDYEASLMSEIEGQSTLFSRIRRLPVGENRNSLSIPALAETSKADGSRFGGVLAYWTNESGTATATKPKLREVDIKLSKLLAFCYLTEELMVDARTIEAFVRGAYAEEMAFKIDDAIINGSGNGIPLGILNAPSLITVAKEAGQGADTIVYENISKMWSRLRARGRSNAVWLVSPEAEQQLSSMVMTVGIGGVPVYLPATGVSGTPYGTLYGRPVLPIEQCQKLGDKGDIILADLRDYIGIDKGGLQADSSIHVQFLYDETAFRFRYRFNGTPYTVSAVASAKNASFTTGPYVTLAERA